MKQQGDFDAAKLMYERAMKGYEQALGPLHRNTLSTVNNLAILLKQCGDLKEAGALYKRALMGREKVLGDNHQETLDTIYNLCILSKVPNL